MPPAAAAIGYVPSMDQPSQREFWNSDAANAWVELADAMDGILAPFGEQVSAALDPRPGERILDIGCGTGATSRALAARVAPSGSVLGVDISARFLEAARARHHGTPNLAFHLGDAGSESLPGAPFDAAFSRFGVMFFEDPTAAFTHLRGSLRPGGRMAFLCWRAMFENAWMIEPMMALLPYLREPPAPTPPDAPGPFAFADGDRLRHILAGAGFSGVSIDRWDTAYKLGPSPAEAVRISLRIGPVGRLIREQQLDPGPISRAFEELLARHATPDGVSMPASCWLVRATA